MLTFVVVRRHQEDLAWLDRLPQGARIVVYNGGPALEPGALRPGAQVETLKAGGQAAAYLDHLRRGFRAADAGFTVFTHADPFDQAPALLHLLQHAGRWRDVQPLSVQRATLKDMPPRAVLDNDVRDWIGELPIRAERFSPHSWQPLAAFDAEADAIARTYRAQHSLPAGTNLAEHFFELCGLHALATAARGGDVGAYAHGSILAVRNRRVEAFVGRFRRELAGMELLARADPNYGEIYERCWLHLFGEPFVQLGALRSDEAPTAADAGSEARASSDATAIAALRSAAYEAWAQGKAAEARAMLHRVLHHDPRNAEVLADFATFAFQAGEYALAARYARNALAVDPANGSTRFTLAMSLGRTGAVEDAAAALRTLLEGEDAAAFCRQHPALADIAHAEAARLRQAA